MLNTISNINFVDSGQFFLLAGPCVVENEAVTMQTAEKLKEITQALEIPFVFKASYRKANRSRIDSFTGIGDEEAFQILEKVKKELELPITTDIHLPEEAAMAAEVADILQIPAFLCRQTDLLVAAAQTNRVINIKKGQFLAPESMSFAAQKVVDSGNSRIMLTDRGTMFGYGDLVVDMRSIPKMQKLGYPVVVDVTHSLQQPNQTSGVTGGEPEMIATISKAAIAAGANGIFLETHPNPAEALSDGANMLHLDKVKTLLKTLKAIHEALD